MQGCTISRTMIPIAGDFVKRFNLEDLNINKQDYNTLLEIYDNEKL